MTPKSIVRPILRVLRGPTPGQAFEIDRDRLTIGRDSGCDVVLDSRSVSRRHARIERRPEGLILRDLGSTGGTWVNGSAIEAPTLLRHGDRIELADCLLVFAARALQPRLVEDEESTILGLRDSSGTAEQLLVGVRPAEKLRAILEINRELVGSLDLDVVLGRVLDGLFRIFPHAERGFILLGEAGAIELTPRAMKLRQEGPSRPTLSRSILEHVMLQGKAVLCEDLKGDPWLGGSASVDEANLRTLMCVPLRDHTRRPVGAIQLDTTNPLARFTSEDLDLLSAVASQVAMAVDNARLYREASEALRRQAESQALVDAILSAAPVAIAFLDRELRYVRVNQAMAAINVLPVEEHLGRRLGDVLPRAAARFEPLIRRVVETGEPILGMEIRAEQPDSSGTRRCWLGYCYPALGPDGTVQGIGVILEDVTEARRAESELRSSEERYRLLFESNPHPMWVYDKETLKFLAVNEAAIRSYGYSLEEFLSMTILDIRPPEDIPSVIARVNDVQGTTYLNAAGWRHLRKDGKIIDVEISSHALEFGGRRARLVLASDVSRRLEAEAAVRAAKESAEAANRAKDRFLAVLSHELRTPLTPVLLAVTSILDSGTAAPDIQPTLEMIRRNIELESRLVDDLLDVARIERGGIRHLPEVIDIHAAIREAVEICRPAIQSGQIDVRLELSASRPNALADPARIKQVFWNLIRNAAKFTPPGGSLTIRSRDESRSGANGPVTRLIVEFSDTGVGIAPAFLPRIFEPFEQGDSSHGHRHGGLGLGLAICRAIVQAHGGELTVSSEGHGRGTTFHLELDSVASPEGGPPGPIKAAPRAAAPRGEGRRILLVEDNRDTLRFLAMVLGQQKFEVHAAGSLESAREALAEGGPFDLLISDIELPDGTGLELMRELREGGVLAGIAMSGFGSEDDVRLSEQAGFLEHLTKPVDIGRLEAAIERALSRTKDGGPPRSDDPHRAG